MELKDTIICSVRMMPKVEGPIPVTDASHPFCAMNYSRCKLNLADYGYLEEEYFLSGSANVYDEELSGSANTYDKDRNGKMFLKYEALPYKNRILVSASDCEKMKIWAQEAVRKALQAISIVISSAFN